MSIIKLWFLFSFSIIITLKSRTQARESEELWSSATVTDVQRFYIFTSVDASIDPAHLTKADGGANRHLHLIMDLISKRRLRVFILTISLIVSTVPVLFENTASASAFTENHHTWVYFDANTGIMVEDGALFAPKSPNWGNQVYEGLLNRAGERTGQCVEWIQREFGTYYTHPDFRGVAGQIEPNRRVGDVGDVVLTSEGSLGHVALVIGKTTNSITVAESNYHGGERLSVGRVIMLDDPKIRGYYRF